VAVVSASLSDYRAALGARGAAGPVLTSALGRFPMAMLGLATLFYVQRGYHSFAVAGLVAAAALTGEAAGSVIQGRIIDRLGPTRPLLLVTAVFTASAAALSLAVEHRLAVPVLVAGALLTGLSFPALPGASRALWARLVPAGTVREAAYTYEAISLEVFFILGPAAAAALLVAPWPGTGFAVAVAAILVGASGFALTPTVRRFRPAVLGGAARPAWGALASPGMRVVALAGLGFGCVVGVVEVGVPAATTAAGRPALAGLLLSGWSIASVLAGLLYGMAPWPRPLHLRLPALVGGFALAVAAMGALAGQGLVAVGAAMLLAGCLLTPQLTAQSLGVEQAALPGTETEAFGWTITTATLGLAGGQALGGWLAQTVGPGAAFLAGGGAGLLVAVALWLARGSLAVSAAPGLDAAPATPAAPALGATPAVPALGVAPAADQAASPSEAEAAGQSCSRR
jgi:MFS family permease